jgi:hypothetical protein
MIFEREALEAWGILSALDGRFDEQTIKRKIQQHFTKVFSQGYLIKRHCDGFISIVFDTTKFIDISLFESSIGAVWSICIARNFSFLGHRWIAMADVEFSESIATRGWFKDLKRCAMNWEFGRSRRY